ncbi:hypothetical protein HDU78_009284 [Chytriomyces hyalinus]|nr:hypothetical protein HDU78_009284 [Chytriomyces hyalinus]
MLHSLCMNNSDGSITLGEKLAWQLEEYRRNFWKALQVRQEWTLLFYLSRKKDLEGQAWTGSSASMHLALALATIAIAAQAQTAPPVQILDAAGNPLPQCAFKPSSGLARLEPPLTNQMMVGISLDWSYETPLKSKEKTKNHTPAV